MDFNIILDNYTLHMIAEKQSISDNYNSFVLHSTLIFFLIEAEYEGRGRMGGLINHLSFVSHWEQIFHESKL